MAGTDFVGAVVQLGVPALDVWGDPVELRVMMEIVDVAPIGDSDVLAHEILLRDDAANEWFDPCDNDGLGVIVLAGDWDLESGDRIGEAGVTLACRGDVLAKCVEWGYEPWLSSPLAELHQSCTRMARADYCGDGTPMTVNGTMIDVYDVLDIQERATRWPVEAEWPRGGRLAVLCEHALDDVERVGFPAGHRHR